MSVSAVLNALLVLAAVGWVLYRQTIARPVVARRLMILPGILAVIGVAAVSHVDNGNLSATAILYLAVDLVASITLGALRGCFVRVFERDGVLWRQGGAVTIALWVVSIGIRIVVAVLAANAGVGNVSSASLELALGVTLLAQNGVVALRGSRLGIPFASGGASRRRSGRIRSNING
jgi:hypothetical protein